MRCSYSSFYIYFTLIATKLFIYIVLFNDYYYADLNIVIFKEAFTHIFLVVMIEYFLFL